MPKLILVGLSDQSGVLDLASRISQLDPQAIVLVTADFEPSILDPIISLFGDLGPDDEPEAVA